ncbi:MAG TPA: NUDIX domain-containing protein [Polyangiaceae bacterium]
MSKVSAGLIMYRIRERLEVLLVHPGGPLWKNKDEGAWSIPKGEAAEGEELLSVALREFTEETALVPRPPYTPLTPIKQKSGKTVHAWACEGDCDPGIIRSNTFDMEWPPRSGKTATFPEVDRADFFDLTEGRRKLNPSQAAFLDELEKVIGMLD